MNLKYLISAVVLVVFITSCNQGNYLNAAIIDSVVDATSHPTFTKIITPQNTTDVAIQNPSIIPATSETSSFNLLNLGIYVLTLLGIVLAMSWSVLFYQQQKIVCKLLRNKA